MVQSVGFDPFLTSFASVDQRRPPEREPDSRRVTPATENESSAADRRRPDPSDAPETAAPPQTRIAFTTKFGPDSDGFPFQLIRGEQVTQAESADVQAIVENRVPREESRSALIQAQESRDDTADATRRQQEAAAERRNDIEAARSERRAETESADNQQQPAGSFLDLQV